MKRTLHKLCAKHFKQGILAVALCGSGGLYAQVIATPLNITDGFNQDIIANGVGNSSASTTMGFDQQNNRALLSADFKATADSQEPDYALPADGYIYSLATSGVTFKLGDYSQKNALYLTPSYVNNGAPDTGTINFSVSGASSLYLLAGATGGGNQHVPANATVLFSDGTSQAALLSVADWYNGGDYAIQGIGRVHTVNNNLEGDFSNPRLYQIEIPIETANQVKTINGITFSFPGAPGAEWANEIRLSVLAVSSVAAAVPATTVTVATQNEAPATITTASGTLQLAATVTPATAGDVTWSVEAGSDFATVSTTGLVTAIANGTVTVRAALSSDTTVFDDIEVTITNQPVAATGVEISVANDALAAINTLGGALQLEADVLPAEATNTDVIWAVTAGSDFASIDENGLVTAIANGTATITVTTADGSFTDTIEIVITGQTIAVTEVTVAVENGAEATITTVGGTLQLVATVSPEDATNANVTWSIVSGSDFASIDENGLVTAIANGAVVIRVTAEDSTIYGEITVTVALTSSTDAFKANSVVVYPNPTSDILNIKSAEPVKAVIIYDNLGREVFKSALQSVNISNLNSGIYLVKIELANNATSAIKVVKR